MKRAISICMAVILCMGMALGLAHAQQDTVVTGTFTQPNGYFMTDGWGVNAADSNVRNLIHGYATVANTPSGKRTLDKTVVKEFLVRSADTGYVTHEFEIQSGLTYNDGTPITAEDYVFSLLLLCSPEIETTGASTLGYSDIRGYSQYHDRDVLELSDEETRTPALLGVHLKDKYTFSVTFSRDDESDFYSDIAYLVQPFPIDVIAPGCEVAESKNGAYIRRILIEADENGDGKLETREADIPEDAPAYYGTFCTEMLAETVADPETGYLYHPAVSCGAYTLVSYDSQTMEAVFEKNTYYKGNYEGQIPSIENLKLCCVTLDSAIEKLASGEVDVLNQITDIDVIDTGLELAKEDDFDSTSYKRNGGGFLYFACEQKVTGSQAVRKAVSYALDKTAFCEAYIGKYGEPIYGYYGMGQWMVQYAVENNEEAFANLKHYDNDLAQAKRMLIKDGWVYNAKGEQYDEATDTVRYRMEEDGTFTSLTLNWARTENSRAAELLEEMLLPNLEKLGFEVKQTEMPFKDMLSELYKSEDREYNMYLLASNFEYLFDPSLTYNIDPAYMGSYNISGLADEELMQLAADMRETEPDDWESYYQKWLDFETCWNELLPAIPLYSNRYYDIYSTEIRGYNPGSTWTWSSAILYATFVPEEKPIELTFELDSETNE